MSDLELMRMAEKARLAAYAPYSDFCVGAALLGVSGKVYCGCNIENAAFSPTVCAERVAIFKAVSEGERSFAAIAVTGGKRGEDASCCTPCGVCRQVMAEFCTADFRVLLGNSEDVRALTLGELLPAAFGNEMRDV